MAILYRRTALRHTRVVVVVGSFGKTTTARALSTVLGTKVSSGGNAYESIVWTMLQVRPGARYAVFEVGIDAPGQMAAYVNMLRPDITVVTSIGSSHNRSLGTLEITRAEKAIMVQSLRPSGLAVLNGDDQNVLWMRNQTNARVLTFGFGQSNDIRASDISFANWPDNTCFTVGINGQQKQLNTRLIGQPGIYAILAATTVAINEDFTLEYVQQRLNSLTPSLGRLQPIKLNNGAVILRDDFKSQLETIEMAFNVLSQIPAKRHIVVLGRLREARGKQGDLYRSLGRCVAAIANRAVFICGKRDSNCRAGAIQAGMQPKTITKAHDCFLTAVDNLKDDLGPGDVILIKGPRTQHLERITLALQGCNIKCKIKYCKEKELECMECPILLKGYNTHEDLPKTRIKPQ